MTDQELFEKLSDPKYFIETFCWIVDKRRLKVPFLFNPPQAKYYANRTLHDLILKARKEGFSSLLEAMFLHACIFIPNTRAVILSHEMEATKRHFDRIKYYLQNLGSDAVKKYVVDLDEDSQKQLKFPGTNSSYWIGTAGARAFGRGDDITHLHLSEVAHYENQDVLTSVLEACVPGAYKVMETTANGVGETFHRMWREAKDPQSHSPWKTHFFAWFEDPSNYVDPPEKFHLTGQEVNLKERYGLSDGQVCFYRNKRAEMADKSLMPQEYPSDDVEAFLSSGRHLFNLEKLSEKRKLIEKTLPLYIGDLYDDGKNIKFRDSEDGPMRVWKPPRARRQYAIAADVAEGVPGGDYSVGQVFDRATWEQVAVIRLRVNPGEWGRMLCTAGYYYNNAVLIPENNNHGQAAIEAIVAANYPHLLETPELWPDVKTVKKGFPTNEKTRIMAITSARNAVDDSTVFINDPITINEMETFVQNADTGKFEAQKGCYDDCVMSFAIGAYCMKNLTVDESYADRVKPRRTVGSSSMITERGDSYQGRRKATGY